MTEHVYLDEAQLEHLAVRAAELGLTEIEDACDELLADGPEWGKSAMDWLVSQVDSDPVLTAWMDRGANLGHQVRTT